MFDKILNTLLLLHFIFWFVWIYIGYYTSAKSNTLFANIMFGLVGLLLVGMIISYGIYIWS